jgi:hypothetical protein
MKTNNSQCCRNYAAMVSFANAFISQIDMELNGTVKVGVVTFNFDALDRTDPQLTNATDAIMVINNTEYLGNTEYRGRSRNTASAFEECRTLVLNKGNNTKQILVLLTAGNPDFDLLDRDPVDEADKNATLVKNANITLIPVGVGEAISTGNLENWGTNGEYLKVTDFDDLDGIIENITDAILCGS